MDMHKLAQKPINPLHYKITSHGIEGFYWPYSRKEVIDFEEGLSEKYCRLVANANLENNDQVILRILQKYFICEAVGIFQSVLLKSRSQSDSIQFTFTKQDEKQYPLWFNFLERGKFPPSKHLTNILSGPYYVPLVKKIFKISTLRKIFKLLRVTRKGLKLGEVSVRPISRSDLQNNIIVTQRTAVINQHCDEVDRNTLYERSEKYFSAVLFKDLDDIKIPEIFDEFVDIFKLHSKDFGAELNDKSTIYFRETLTSMYSALSIHYKRLLKKETLPKNLWIGSGGYVWDALLACAVKSKGGYVCGHGHGSGLAHVNMGFAGFIDLWLCDAYYTFSKVQAEELLNAVPLWSYMGSPAPITLYPNSVKSQTIDKMKKAKTAKRDRQKIYILSTIYDLDRGRHCPLMPDLTQIDWQARLVAHLKQSGYDVVIKAHPESPFPPPEALKKLGAEVTQERFEDILLDADLFIFDNIYTSVFRSSLTTNIPVIIIDFEGIPLTNKAKNMLDRRCAFVKGEFDELNRAVIKWGNLSSALDSDLKSISYDFISQYYDDPLIESM